MRTLRITARLKKIGGKVDRGVGNDLFRQLDKVVRYCNEAF
jgi:hypothetical protein